MPDNVLGGGNGLVPESEWRGSFPDGATSLLDSLRHGLEARVPELGEKVNLALRYFGYSVAGGSDAAYINVQRANLVLDLRLAQRHEGDLRAEGYEVRPRDNFQGQAGWLTGWRVPQDYDKPLWVLRWMVEALRHDSPVGLDGPPFFRDAQGRIDTASHLEVGKVYTRKELGTFFRITDATIRTGTFQPRGHDSVWLFVTENKTPDRTQYEDRLDGDDLHWDGQTAGRTDSLVVEHRERGLVLLLFHRMSRDEHPGAGFRYEGPFGYVAHSGSGPAHFLLRRAVPGVEGLADEGQRAILGAAGDAFARARGQGFASSSEVRKAVENHAMAMAIDHFGTEGYEVEDVSGNSPYDLRCRRSGETLHVEVKGTQTSGEDVLLTPNEVTFARKHRDEMALFVVHSVAVSGQGSDVQTSGGAVRLLRPWDVDAGELRPVGYSYGLPRP